MSDTILQLDGLQKYYTSNDGIVDRLLGNTISVKAVDGVSINVKEGETVGIVGESGCGKTTLGETIMRLHDPTGGEIKFDGQDISEFSRSNMKTFRKRMQMIFQDPNSNLDPRMTVGDIIEEPMDRLGVYSSDERRERAKELLDRVQLDRSYYDRYPHEFSGGQKQRIGIARAISVDPEFVVCDEPVSALDVSVQAQVLGLLDELQEELGLTFLFISHDLSVIRYICDRVGVMYLGELVEIGETEDIFTNPQHPYTRALLSAVPDPNPHHDRDRILLEGTPPSPANPPSGCRFHTRCPEKIGTICETEDPATFDVEGTGHGANCHLHSSDVDQEAVEIDGPGA